MKVDKISKLANTFSEGVDAIEVQQDGFSLGEKNIYENSYENPLDFLNSLYSDFKNIQRFVKGYIAAGFANSDKLSENLGIEKYEVQDYLKNKYKETLLSLEEKP